LPALRFTPYAWSKLLFLRDCGHTEVGGFALSAAGDLLLIEDVRLIRQRSTVVSVEFEDEAVADFFDQQIDAGLLPERFFRVWIHTHPGDSADPSGTDEETFRRVFGGCDWAVMAILAQGGETTARLRFSAGSGGDVELPLRIDYAPPFPASDSASWEREYEHCVRPCDPWHEPVPAVGQFDFQPEPLGWDEWDFFFDERQPNDTESRPVHAAAGPGAAGETFWPDGDGDRRGRDRPAGGDPIGGARRAATAVG
jgi:proteasome lid subunit RPN8/RPN11